MNYRIWQDKRGYSIQVNNQTRERLFKTKEKDTLTYNPLVLMDNWVFILTPYKTLKRALKEKDKLEILQGRVVGE